MRKYYLIIFRLKFLIYCRIQCTTKKIITKWIFFHENTYIKTVTDIDHTITLKILIQTVTIWKLYKLKSSTSFSKFFKNILVQFSTSRVRCLTWINSTQPKRSIADVTMFSSSFFRLLLNLILYARWWITHSVQSPNVLTALAQNKRHRAALNMILDMQIAICGVVKPVRFRGDKRAYNLWFHYGFGPRLMTIFFSIFIFT